MKTVDPTLLNDADFSEQVTLESVVEPPKRWCNWWRAVDDIGATCARTGVFVDYSTGEVFIAPAVWPTKDAAQTYAAEIIADQIAHGFKANQYLGAHPVEGDA